MLLFDVFIHWLHLMGAVIWVGGMIFAGWMLTPVARQELPPNVRAVLFRRIGKRFYIIGWVALAVLIGTGTYKISLVWGTLKLFDSIFGGALLLKLSLVSIMLVLSFLHDFIWGPRLAKFTEDMDPNEYRKAVARISFWARVNVFAAILIVFLGAFLRMNPF